MKIRVLFLLAFIGLICPLYAEPPKLTIPPNLKPVNGYIRFSPETTAKGIVYIAQDDAYPFPSEELKDSKRFVLPVTGLKDKTYRFFAVGTLNDEQTVVPFTITIGTGTDPGVPPIGGPPKEPPTTPPVTPSGKYTFTIIRKDGAPSFEYSQLLTLPGWDTLRLAGHTITDMTVPEAVKFFGANSKIPADSVPPFIVVLQETADKKNSVVVKPSTGKPGVVKFPASNEEILKLPESVR